MTQRPHSTPSDPIVRPTRRATLRRLMAFIPPEPASSPIDYSVPLVAYVTAIVTLAILMALATVRAPSDLGTLLLGAAAIVGLELVKVRSFGGVSAPWSPAAFAHLALSLAFGPIGAIVSAAAGSVAVLVRLRTGWFRALLNAADLFLANLAAWATFHAAQTPTTQPHVWITALTGLVAGAASFLVNGAILCVAVRLAAGVSIGAFMRSAVEVIPYELACGVGAAGFSVFYAQGGAAYLAMWLAPVVAIQSFLVRLAIRANAHAAEAERHARERVELLQRIITAADTERFKTAGDLHDGPVGTLAGLAMILHAGLEDGTPDSQRQAMIEVAGQLHHVRDELRNLIFELSPHDLDKPGRLRDEIDGKLAAELRERGVDVKVAIPDALPLDRAGLELVHRVCREALANVRRHAHATHVRITAALTDGKVVVTVDDDGRGFAAEDVERQRAAGHFGTRFLAEKAELAHGTFAVQSEPGEGSHVRLILPTADAAKPFLGS